MSKALRYPTGERMKNLSSQRIADLIVTCIEGGSEYWVERIDLHGKDYSKKSTYEGTGWKLTVYVDEGDEVVAYIFDKDAVQKGLEYLFSNERYHDFYKAITSDDFDAEDADCFLQASLFGELVYG
jgi:hypothetical protein